ncbi:hypothetical protein D9758_006458 [Tetrapyrgos nigripes]|uniref:Uncharacterized protein n=1 Tax=Tetrapyrgos nigripes TaxID=182062 RepID=A0A8H5GLE1_9AGAR|nr:hypothetical protein D9758_006458 [Tetrapyrgos nigripes]
MHKLSSRSCYTMSNSSSVIPNPVFPLELEDELHQLQITMAIATATMGMYIWDICIHLTEDYQLLSMSGSRPFPTIVYFVARLSSLGFVFTNTFELTLSQANCAALSYASVGFTITALGCVTFLFFLRLRAVYYNNHLVILLFFAIWLGNLACISMAALIYFPPPYPMKFAGTTYCVKDDLKIGYASITAIGPLVHDTCVFLAISYRLFKNSFPDGSGSGPGHSVESLKKSGDVEKYVLGKNLPHLSRALFQHGQLLYL